jgi:hypothetical protein
LIVENAELTQIAAKKNTDEDLNESAEKENEKFLNVDSDEHDGDSDQSILSNHDQPGCSKPTEENKFDLLEQSMAPDDDDDDESDNEKSFSSQKESATTKPPEASHYCSYFQKDSTQSNLTCQHQQNASRNEIKQNVCLNCEFARELNDSLDHMAFLSPSNKETTKKFLTDELKFQSPTNEASLKALPNEKSQDEEEEDEDFDDNDVVNETICEIEVRRGHSGRENTPREEKSGWFTPGIQVPRPDELDGAVSKPNNDTIVKYYKDKDKYKMVNF